MQPHHQAEMKRLRDIPRMRAIMDANIARNPEFYRGKMQLLDHFFAEHPSPVDIGLILYGALADAHVLAYHLEGNNLLFYRPKASHNWTIEKTLLLGEPHPERTLLLFDQDMVTGNAMRESADFFTSIGYNRSKIYGYLDIGCAWRGEDLPELMHIDDLLKK
jgi:hypothetical protein